MDETSAALHGHLTMLDFVLRTVIANHFLHMPDVDERDLAVQSFADQVRHRLRARATAPTDAPTDVAFAVQKHSIERWDAFMHGVVDVIVEQEEKARAPESPPR